ncbi:MAG: prolyl oligopeptidase family serine peptidase [Polyangiaceae bacterium]|jgi:esterase/lipase superfamily enzyme|nr:prolyl oligopeptidase family serine peptidase [Polyangiaceae bacterium]MBK8939389.1 prolyl oligopeptidase family serine peptidase [Polyangiaceae bacterium]
MQFVDPALPRDIFGWRSPALGLDMPVVTYGHAGHPLLLFPTAAADFLENERFFLIKSIEPYLFEGRVRVFSIDSINRYAWMDDDLPIREKARRQALYVRYIEEELVPHIRRVSGDRRIATSGASFGAFHAANALFRRPDLFDCVIAMSGFYDLHPGWSEGLSNDDVYFNNPASYLPNLEGEPLDRLRHDCQIHIITGRGEHEAPQRSEQLSRILSAKGIPHNLDMWGYDVNHDWPWWRRMLPHYIGERVGW